MNRDEVLDRIMNSLQRIVSLADTAPAVAEEIKAEAQQITLDINKL